MHRETVIHFRGMVLRWGFAEAFITRFMLSPLRRFRVDRFAVRIPRPFDHY